MVGDESADGGDHLVEVVAGSGPVAQDFPGFHAGEDVFDADAGAAVFVGLRMGGADPGVAALAAAALTFALRAGALRLGWGFPERD